MTSFHSHSETNYLLRSFIGSHGPVSSSTVGRWLKVCLKNAGVRFQAHSVRAEATSKASLSGLTVVEDILKAAD